MNDLCEHDYIFVAGGGIGGGDRKVCQLCRDVQYVGTTIVSESTLPPEQKMQQSPKRGEVWLVSTRKGLRVVRVQYYSAKAAKLRPLLWPRGRWYEHGISLVFIEKLL